MKDKDFNTWPIITYNGLFGAITSGRQMNTAAKSSHVPVNLKISSGPAGFLLVS